MGNDDSIRHHFSISWGQNTVFCPHFFCLKLSFNTSGKKSIVIQSQIDPIPTLIRALDDTNKFIQYYASISLIKFKHEANAIPVLIDLLKTEIKGEFRKAIEECTAQIGQLVVPEILVVARDSSKTTAQISAIKILGNIGANAESAIPELIGLLNDPNTKDEAKLEITNSIRKFDLLDSIGITSFVTHYEV